MQISGVLVLLATIMISRIVNERAYRQLSKDEKVRLMDGFSATRAYAFIPLFVLIVAFWLLVTYTTINLQYLTVGYFSLLICYVLIRTGLNQRKMHQLGLPKSYQRIFTISQMISLVGIAWFFYTIFYENNL